MIRWLVRILAIVVAFAAGVAFGQALEDRPAPGKPVTSVVTFEPWTQTNGGSSTAEP